MQVNVLSEQTDLSCDLSMIQEIARKVVALEGQTWNEVTIIFLDKDEMGRVHAAHFDDPSPTDCMSFPLDDPDEEGYRILGDVLVCPAVAVDYVNEHGGDPWNETLLYVIHGLLHLMGYRDKTEAERKEMRAAEQRHLQHALYPDCDL